MKYPLNGTNTPPRAPSDKPSGASVNSDTTRGKTAPTPGTLGPRTA